jgi:hypothetical protein
MAPTYAAMHGTSGVRRLRASCAALVMASNFPIISTALTAMLCSGHTDPGARRNWIKVKNPDAPAAIRLIE